MGKNVVSIGQFVFGNPVQLSPNHRFGGIALILIQMEPRNQIHMTPDLLLQKIFCVIESSISNELLQVVHPSAARKANKLPSRVLVCRMKSENEKTIS